jgi:Fanconi anemia group J protein
VSKIYFASRTHSQLAQLVSELKATAYKPTMSILGSRQQYCINPLVTQSDNRNEECQKLLDFGECRMHRQVQRVRAQHTREARTARLNAALQSGGKHQLFDIEELVAMGTRANACPYFAARQLAELPTTDIVFLPYNYLVG